MKTNLEENFEQAFYDDPEDLVAGVRVLIIDDEKMARAQLSLVCSSATDLNIYAVSCGSIAEGLNLLSEKPFDVVLLDKDLNSENSGEYRNGIEAIPEVLAIRPSIQTLVVTGSKDLKDCVRAMQLGAFGYVHKADPEAYLLEQIRKASQLATLKLAEERFHRQKKIEEGKLDFDGRSNTSKALKKRLSAVAETSRPVLLTGETGTGKTTAAKFIHDYRAQFLKQSNRPFLALNMGALPANLVEGELFGHERGAFTDAKDAKPGYFEMADGGTLFLDEIGEAPLELQVKLLKVIEEGKFRRVGGTKERSSSFKLICATNRDLEKMVREGSFREDLFMRISTFIVPIPSLRERREDIPDIIRSVFVKCCRENNKNLNFKDIPQDLMQALVNNPPRGNIRGLEQFLSRLLVLAPQDKNGSPQLTSWRQIEELSGRQRQSKRGLSVRKIRTRQLIFDDPDFPGAREFTEEIIDKIIKDSKPQFKNQREMATALKITPGALSQRLKRLKQSEGTDEG